MQAVPRRPRRRTAKEHGPDPVDIHVGRQLRLARELAGLTQVEIGRRLAMSFQLVQKYEQGEIRVSASRLYRLAQLVGQPVTFFFASYEAPELAEERPAPGRHELELVRAWRLIASPTVQQRLLALVKDVAEGT
jgi:transcriptional regulator with XRE-family HTH domain